MLSQLEIGLLALAGVEVKQLEALVAVAEEGSFSAAALALGTVQSNVSTRVAKLERELNVVLVERGKNRLTQEGEIVVARARRVLSELGALIADVVSLRADVVGTVAIGLIGTTGRWLVPALLGEVLAQHPNIHLRISDGTSSLLEDQLAIGELDLALVNIPLQREDLVVEPLFTEEMRLVVPSGHELAEAYGGPEAVVPMAEVAALPLLLPLTGTALRAELDQVAAKAGTKLEPLIELDGLRMLASLTFDGHGPGILPATAIPQHLADRFATLGIEGTPTRHVGVAQRRQGLPSSAVRVVAEALRSAVAGLGASPVPPGIVPSA